MPKIRKKQACIRKIYTVDYFPNCTHIHLQASPSINVLGGPVPMTLTATLFEPSFVDLIAAVEHATELSEQCRRHWVCSLRQLAKWLDRPVEVIPARWQAVRFSIGQLHHARVGVTAKTLSNPQI